MPQSTGILPCPISRRSAMIFSTRGCSLKFGGTAVSRSASACSSASGMRVSSFSFHLVPRYFDQSTAKGGLKFERIVLLVWKPPSSAWRKVPTIRSASSASITPWLARRSA